MGRADDELLSAVPEHQRHTSRGEGLERRPGFGQGQGDRRGTDPLEHPPRFRIEAYPVPEDRLQRGDRPTTRRGKQRPRNGKPVEGEARHQRHPIPVEQRHLNGHRERTGPEIPGQEGEPTRVGKRSRQGSRAGRGSTSGHRQPHSNDSSLSRRKSVPSAYRFVSLQPGTKRWHSWPTASDLSLSFTPWSGW